MSVDSNLWSKYPSKMRCYIFIFTLLCSCGNKSQTNNKKYSEFFGERHNKISYYDYNEALYIAKKEKKPLLIIFCGWGVVNTLKFEKEVLSDKSVLNYIKTNFILVNLYVDDRTILLKKEWKKSKMTDRYLKTIGSVNSELQITKFHNSSQPYWVIIRENESIIAEKETRYFDNKEFLAFLEKANRVYSNK